MRRKMFDSEDEDEELQGPTGDARMSKAHVARRRLLAELRYNLPQHLDAIKKVAQDVYNEFHVPLPIKTEEQKMQYTDYKMICDVIEQVFLQINQEAEIGLREAQTGMARNYEEEEKWTTLKVK